MSAALQPVFFLEPGGNLDTVEQSLRSIARQHVQHYSTKQRRRAQIINTLRNRINAARTIAEESQIEPTALELLFTNLLNQLVLLDELERNN